MYVGKIVHIPYCSTTFHLQALCFKCAEENCFSCFWQCEHVPHVCLLLFNKLSILPRFIFVWLTYLVTFEKGQVVFAISLIVLIHVVKCVEKLSFFPRGNWFCFQVDVVNCTNRLPNMCVERLFWHIITYLKGSIFVMDSISEIKKQNLSTLASIQLLAESFYALLFVKNTVCRSAFNNWAFWATNVFICGEGI